jgi:hypothetical protein
LSAPQTVFEKQSFGKSSLPGRLILGCIRHALSAMLRRNKIHFSYPLPGTMFLASRQGILSCPSKG